MNSVNLQSSTSHCECESLVSQDPTWTSKTAVAADGLFHSTLHMNIDVDTSSASSENSHDMELPGDLGNLSFSSSIMYARGFIGQNDIRSSNSNIFPDNSSLRETFHPGGFSIPDFATSMFPVISRMFPRAASSPHLVILGNNSAFNSALSNMSHPSTLQLVHQQRIDHQIIYLIFHRLINDSEAVWVLEKPKTELDQIFKAGVMQCFSLGKGVLGSLIDSTPPPFNLALKQNIFRAALVLGNGPVLNKVLGAEQASLKNQLLNMRHGSYYPLEYAAIKGHIQAIQALLDHGADPNQPANHHHDLSIENEFLDKALGRPWEKKDPKVGLQILRLLIHHGLESKPLQSVRRMEKCSKDTMLVLATHCLDKSFETFFQHYGLVTVLQRQDWEDPSSKMLKVILNQAFLESNDKRETWSSVLSESLSAAILRRHVSAVEVLLSMGATPDTHCLISAAQSDNVQILKDFLGRGLDPNSRATKPYLGGWGRDEDCTALSESIMNRSRGAFELLKEQGYIAILSHQPAGYVSAFIAACEAGDSAVLEQLLSMPSFPSRRAKLGKAIEAAIEGGQYHIIEKLLSAGIQPSVKGFALAIQKRQLRIVIRLARYVDLDGSIPVATHPQKNLVLWEALRWGNQTVVECVLRIGQPINVCDRMQGLGLKEWDLLPEVPSPGIFGVWSYTPLAAAILGSNISVVKTLMTYGLQAVLFTAHSTSYRSWSSHETVDFTAGWALTPLAAAAITADLPLIREILRIGADPFDNSALLICAMIDSEDEVVALVLSAFKIRYPYGAHSFASDALYQTIRRGNKRLFGLLFKDADLTGPVTDYYGSKRPPESQADTMFTSPLGEAIRRHAPSEGAGGALDRLLPLVKDFNVIVHKSYKHGNMTSLLYAIFLGSLAAVQKLHQAGADISLVAEWSITRTPLQAASEGGHKDIVEYLLREGVNPNESPAEQGGATALQLAAIKGNIGIAAILLDNGADINALPAFCDGRTAFEGATEHGRIEMMIFVVNRGANLLSDGNSQYRRAVEFAESNSQYAAKALAKDLYEKTLASQVANFIGGDVWAGPDMRSLEGLLS